MSVTHVATKGYTNDQYLGCHLWQSWYSRAVLLLRLYRPEWHSQPGPWHHLERTVAGAIPGSVAQPQSGLWWCSRFLLPLRVVRLPGIWHGPWGRVGIRGPRSHWVHADLNDLHCQSGSWWHFGLGCWQGSMVGPWTNWSHLCWYPQPVLPKGHLNDLDPGYHLGPYWFLRAVMLPGPFRSEWPMLPTTWGYGAVWTWGPACQGLCLSLWSCLSLGLCRYAWPLLLPKTGKKGLHRVGSAPHWLQHWW